LPADRFERLNKPVRPSAFRHAHFNPKGKGNSIQRRLASRSLSPHECSFEVIEFGPIHPEQKTFDAHRPLRDEVEAVEFALALALKCKGYDVIGTHQCAQQLSDNMRPIVMLVLDRVTREFGLNGAE
jgi:hypothetical protein